MTIIYANATMADAVERTRRFRLVKVLKSTLRPDVATRWVNIYESTPAV
jgi:hypothetical protein